MTRVFCDSSTKEGCYVFDGKEPVIIPYNETVTNNVGEYKIVILALEEAKRLGLKEVEVLTDSQLVVNQVRGDWKCRMKHLLPFRDKVRELLGIHLFYLGHWGRKGDEGVAQFDSSITLDWIPREENLAGKVLG